ncbi:hypothetical protein NUSPORA_00687 [Nucleospora cyclopteri]
MTLGIRTHKFIFINYILLRIFFFMTLGIRTHEYIFINYILLVILFYDFGDSNS